MVNLEGSLDIRLWFSPMMGIDIRKPDVPPNAGILYELELLEVDEPIDFDVLPEEKMLTLV